MPSGEQRRAAVVTGAARGIGAGIVRALLDDGWPIVAVDTLHAGDDSLVRDAELAGDRLELVTADVASPSDWDHVVSTAERAFGGIDVLVNNAAISPKHGGTKLLAGQVSLEEWARVLDVNLTGAFLGVQAVLGSMTDRRWGRIINISSQAAHTGARVAGVHYGATKAGLLGITRTVAHEYGPSGITSNAITPGRIETPMAAVVAEEVNRQMLAAIPVGRLGMASDVGAVAAFLASDAAEFINGATIDVNGGSRMG
ncbi:MAG: NAD(P)-dependent oxidoreductase [Marmoricola sp.]|nr:NAD(P)-dependent oxidoreductase [Marmoricola sp.]